jgi:hypothetical protein
MLCRNLASKKERPPHPGLLPRGGEGVWSVAAKENIGETMFSTEHIQRSTSKVQQGKEMKNLTYGNSDE